MRLLLSAHWWFAHRERLPWLNGSTFKVVDRYLLAWPLSYVRLP